MAKPKAKPEIVHSRLSEDLLKNAQVMQDIVDDPYERGAKIVVWRSTRDDILKEMLARKEIDQAQYDAGRKYERYAEQADIGNVQAVDPGKESVDGGKGYEGLTDAQIDAVRQLSEAARVLGAKGEQIVRAILIDRRRFSHLAGSRAIIAQTRVRFFTYLEVLAELWGCVTRRGTKG